MSQDNSADNDNERSVYADDNDNGDHQSNPRDLLENVAAALGRHASKDVFAIGGKISLSSVVLRWDSGKMGQGRKVSLPLGEDTAASGAFQQLLDDCQPATFGKGKEDVLDEDYRKASKMDVSQFCTDFTLAEHGVIDTVTQALVQGAPVSDKYNGVRAELYKLNVYSGPSGKFKSHVDTPRSESQMGSLVVCLPYRHQGGALAVRHNSQEVLFDWSSCNPDSVQWAAFFSDCEHEVLEVTEGHRVTLTYNLYWTDYGPSLMATHLDALNQPSLPFYTALEKLVRCPSFLPKGGLIGFSCTHGYPHTSKSAVSKIKRTLKGLDMVMYQALERLVSPVQVLAVLDGSEYEQNSDDHYYSNNSDIQSDYDAGDSFTSSSYLTTFLFEPILYHDYEEEQSVDPASIDHTVSHNGGPWEPEPAFPKKKVTWLNGSPRSFEELAVAFITYGNQAEIDAYYSTAAIIARLPEYSKRKLA